MTFLQPAALWAAVTIPLIVLLYMLKKKTRPQSVSSIMLWERLERTSTPSWKLSRLLRNLLLLMQILAASLLVLALAGPSLPLAAGGGQGGHTIVILDTSYSMAVEEAGATRLEQARQALRDMIARKGSGEAMAVVAMAGRARVVSGFTADPAALLQAANRLAVEGGRADLREALILAESLSRGLEGAAAVVISDGGCGEGDVRITLPLGYISVGVNPVQNLFIADMIADGQRLYVTVHNNGTLPARGTVRLQGSGGEPAGQREVALEPGESAVLTWREPPSSPWYRGEILSAGDQLPWDDTFFAFATGGENRRLLMVSAGNLFLERALMLQPGLIITKTSPVRYRPEMSERHDLFVFDGFLPETLPAAPVLVFDPPHPNPHFATTAPFRPGRLWTAAHPLTAYADFGEVALSYAKALPGAGRPLLQAAEGNVAVELERQGLPLVVFGFAVQAGDLPLRPAFPVLIRNVIDFFTGLAAAPGRIRFGDPLFLDPPYGVEAVEVVDPAGRARRVAGPFPYRGDPVTETGIYTIIAGERSYPVAVNPPVMTESLAAAESITAGGERVAGSRQAPGRLPLVTPLLLAALFLVGLEWWVDNRGY